MWLPASPILFFRNPACYCWPGIITGSSNTINRYYKSVIDSFIGKWWTLDWLQFVVMTDHSFSTHAVRGNHQKWPKKKLEDSTWLLIAYIFRSLKRSLAPASSSVSLVVESLQYCPNNHNISFTSWFCFSVSDNSSVDVTNFRASTLAATNSVQVFCIDYCTAVIKETVPSSLMLFSLCVKKLIFGSVHYLQSNLTAGYHNMNESLV